MNAEGRIRNWIDPFDRWHLWLLPPILVGLLLAIVLLPHPSPRQPSQRRPIPLPIPAPVQAPAPAQGAVTPRPPNTLARTTTTALATTPALPRPRPIRPTRIESPSANALFWRDRLGDVEGTAEPSSTVRLYLGDKAIGTGTTDPEGRYRFRLANFPPGLHRIQVLASSTNFSNASDTVTFTVKAERLPKQAPATKPSKKGDPPRKPAAAKNRERP